MKRCGSYVARIDSARDVAGRWSDNALNHSERMLAAIALL